MLLFGLLKIPYPLHQQIPLKAIQSTMNLKKKKILYQSKEQILLELLKLFKRVLNLFRVHWVNICMERLVSAIN